MKQYPNLTTALFSTVTGAVFSALLAGCGPTYYWVKPGATNSDWNLDSTECRVYATGAVPRNPQQIQLSTGYRNSSITNCSSFGSTMNCTTTGGEYVPPTYWAYDANDGVRSDAVNLCMYRKGWQRATAEELDAKRAKQATYEQPSMMQCQSDGDCEHGKSCRSRSGGGSECRASTNERAIAMDCQVSSDCPPGKACRSRAGGGTVCR
ncbi:MAG: hypothetical protein IPH26_11440 [Sterolibacteriaceae bacterium]|uniref:Lipoprotein n=1 Tax=Candidatus Methylophosphatis roskildensis TaxID=2899263 RepID=A0A9D7DZ30_9PROT|nr:hypothetical protein [Candidatus Methylophosphatis roskildensis]MBK7236638.1 hypothetical protein [Sterolibacteriaceae bacterium]